MITTTTLRHLAVILFLALLAMTASAGLRETRAEGWQIATNIAAASPHPTHRGALPLPAQLRQGPHHPQNIRPAVVTNCLPGEIIVKLRNESQALAAFERAADAGKAGALARPEANELSPLLEQHRATPVGNVFSRARRDAGAAAGLAKSVDQNQRDALFRWHRLQLPKEADLQKVLADFQANPAVEYAEPAYHYRLHQVVDPPITGLPDGTTDPQMGQQWHHTAARIQAAWNYLKLSGVPVGGDRDIVVAVIDTGVDYHHEELVGNIWTNPREIPGNNLDDDGNGFIDDIHGSSVVSDGRSHAGDPIDLHGHGTHVSGIIAATAFNLKGGVGVAFNVQIMAIRAAQYSGALTTTDIAEGILYAVDNGAEVINMSFGGYQRSQIVVDALAVALNQAVLVAAAGNDGLNGWINPSYPAALPFVHGVMASSPDGRKAWFSNYGYDLAAPGESIFSTLPGNQYAQWSGTSMAAPIISGIAALMRSYWWQREIYSSRFLMGGLWNAGSPVIDAYRAVSELPTPGVDVLETWLFDDAGISNRNDGDGRVDSGETLHLGIELINRSGQANNVVATLRAQAEGAVFEDPFVTIPTNTFNWGNIGPFNTADNGFIYNAGGVITGVERPLIFIVSSNCPNDHVIQFQMTITFEDGWNPESPGPLTRVSRFRYIVQRGKNVPRVISTNTVLSADEYWMVASPVLIEPGATLTVGPGTQVQWGGISDDPYNPGPQSGSLFVRGNFVVAGTAEQPAALFPSYLVAGQRVNITVEEGGTAELAYATVRNPNLTGFRTIDHGYFDWEFGVSAVTAQVINNSAFRKFRGGGTISAQQYDRCLFDAGWLVPAGTPRLANCVFLQDNENQRSLSLNVPWSFSRKLSRDGTGPELFYLPLSTNGYTYVILPMERGDLRLAETIARYYGGHVTSVRHQAESDCLRDWVTRAPMVAGTMNWFLIGLDSGGQPGPFHWTDGEPLGFTDWNPGEPPIGNWDRQRTVVFAEEYRGQGKRFGWSVKSGYSWRWNGAPDWWNNFLLRLPGDWTTNELAAPILSGEMLNHVREQFPGEWRHNAFLSPYWSPTVSHWMRFVAPNDVDGYSSLRSNYWGTGTALLVDHAILDYYDNFLTARVDYGELPERGFATTFPFVEKLLINGVSAETVPQLGTARAEFTVLFNRDMSTNVEPFVTFGPSPPHTDFSVTPRDAYFHVLTNGWLNARTWHGSAWITPVTGEGYQLMRISGAVAADDAWLVSGYDVGRFRFKVQTMGIASMTLQASGQEGAIRLTWQQNDYDLLAGYNLYRADNTNGPWTRLNDTVIPPGSESFSDLNVPPAVPKFYRFTVLTTDMTESEPSNIAAAAALDTVPPVLTHVPVPNALPARGLQLRATATDNLRVIGVSVYYRSAGSGSNYTSLPMVNVNGNEWSASIPGSAVQSPGVEYYLTATDGISEVFSGTPLLPHIVQVSNVPSLGSVTPNHGPSEGGTVVTLSGTLFEPGIGVLFGGVLASDVTLLSANQLACLTPPHFPGLVDVTVVNTDGTQSTLLNAFRFEQSGVVVSLPVTNGNYGTQVEVALSAAGVVGLRAVDVTLTYDPTVLSIVDARAGPLVTGWALSANLAPPGRIVMSLASASSVTGSGSLVLLRFNVIKAPPAATVLTIESLSLNDGAMTATRSDGSFTVNGFFTLSGGVQYFSGNQQVPEVSISLAGAGAFTTTSSADGQFVITNIPTGSYVLTPAKSGDVTEITAYDASLILQSAAGLLTLSANQRFAADVNRNGAVTAMDAAYVLEKAVGLIEGAFPGSGRVWDFVPGQRDFPLLNANVAGQNFTAILLGDVSGNWAPPAGASASQGRGPKSDDPAPIVLAAFDAAWNSPPGQRSLRLLLKATNATILSVDTMLAIAPANRTVLSTTADGELALFALASNTNTPGLLRAALASSTPTASSGPALVVNLAGEEAATLILQELRLNEGALAAVLTQSLDPFDADGDGLIDYDEVHLFGTNPNLADTDGDGMSDGAEVLAGTDPLQPSEPLTIITGSIQLEGYTGPVVGGVGQGGTRAVTFVATSNYFNGLITVTNVLKSWTKNLSVNANGVASYALTDAPASTMFLSAKTAWTLRRKVVVTAGSGGNVAHFTGANQMLGGDFDDSNRVSSTDYSYMRGAWLHLNPVPDIDGSGRVSSTDYSILRGNWLRAGDPQ